jgi:hypothetical protein
MQRWHFGNCEGVRKDMCYEVWEGRYGSIPTQPDGKRRMAIHHIDGDHYNNTIENLTLVTTSEHARIHGQQGDTGIVEAIAANQRKVYDGTHHFYNSEVGSKGATRRNAIHGNPVNKPGVLRKIATTKRLNGTTPGDLVRAGKSNLVTNHPMKTLYRCTVTGRVNTKTAFTRWYKESLPYLEIYNV